MLQSKWVGTRSACVHIAATGGAPGLWPEVPYGLIGLCRALAAARAGPAPTIVFHAQSSLPLLCLAYLLRRWLPDRRAAFVYDIHDLHRSEEHTSELQSLMRNSYAVFCLKKKQ